MKLKTLTIKLDSPSLRGSREIKFEINQVRTCASYYEYTSVGDNVELVGISLDAMVAAGKISAVEHTKLSRILGLLSAELSCLPA